MKNDRKVDASQPDAGAALAKMAAKINLSRWLLRSAHSVLLCSVKTLPSGNFPLLLPSLPIANLPLDLFKRPLQRIEVERFAGTLLEAPL